VNSNDPEIQTFVRRDPDGTERTHYFAPFPTGEDSEPDVVHLVMVPVRRESGDGLRHLSYEDPPGIGVTAGQWRDMLSRAVRASDSEAEFTEMLVVSLGRDLVLVHGCEPHVAYPAVVEFARKVYAEFSGTI
jgi:hypothetical protein